MDWPDGASTLDANIDDTTETITLASDPGSAMSTATFYVRIDFEQIYVVSRAGAVLTCTGGRGANGTSAAAHDAGADVTQDFLAQHMTEVRDAINTLEAGGGPYETFAMTKESADATSAIITFCKGRGSTGAPSVITSGDVLKEIHVKGYGATAYKSAARLLVRHASGAPGDTAMPGVFDIYLSPLASVTPALQASFQANAVSGSTATPAFYLSGDTTSGLYRPAANQIGVAISGARHSFCSAQNMSHFSEADDASTPFAMLFYKKRLTTPFTVAANDLCFRLRGYGYGTSAFVEAARITVGMASAGTFSDASMPGQIMFFTTPDGATSPVEAMRIQSDKQVNCYGNVLQVGFNDTQYGHLKLFGHGAGDTHGGHITMYNAADHDATVDYYQLKALSGDLILTAATTTILSVDDTTLLVTCAQSFDCTGTYLKLPVKATAGDPGSPANGWMYVNTADNKIRVYADAAWRDLVTW